MFLTLTNLNKITVLIFFFWQWELKYPDQIKLTTVVISCNGNTIMLTILILGERRARKDRP